MTADRSIPAERSNRGRIRRYLGPDLWAQEVKVIEVTEGRRIKALRSQGSRRQGRLKRCAYAQPTALRNVQEAPGRTVSDSACDAPLGVGAEYVHSYSKPRQANGRLFPMRTTEQSIAPQA
jgi:hypothetical protein